MEEKEQQRNFENKFESLIAQDSATTIPIGLATSVARPLSNVDSFVAIQTAAILYMREEV